MIKSTFEEREITMAFCTECGQQLAEGAKFCFKCGAKVCAVNTTHTNQRITVYDGEIHKCPNCGEILSSFVGNCPSCGYELRNAAVSSVFSQFVGELDRVTTNKEREYLIRAFPVPNTKEDIFEFLILALSNVATETNRSVFSAWEMKLEQCYHKAMLVLSPNDCVYVNKLHKEATQKIKTRKFLLVFKFIVSIVAKLAFVYFVILWAIVCFAFPALGIPVAVVVLLIIIHIRKKKGDWSIKYRCKK